MGLSNRDDIERGIKKLFRPGDVVELRMPKAGANKTISGYFNDFTKLADAVAYWSVAAPNIYWTLNPVNPDLLARASYATVG